jgi:hypothetical protein
MREVRPDHEDLKLMNARDQRIAYLLDQIETLLDRSGRLVGPHLPRWRRVLGAIPAAYLLRRVSGMMDEVNALHGQPRPAEKWLGVGRNGWLFWQFVIGVENAWSAIDAASQAHWVRMTVSGVCVFVTAFWRLPYKPPRYLNQIEKETP